ncbi:MAG: alpha-ketoglutarate-dependent dioxygenase AlkB [Pseudohongiella sp.]|jgi:alkylated DNA repair dioxygenase AlkB|nr:alpha-ketoglutarate-dependent dioxygenase AlkB [Pseudohongiella sp.]
MQANLFDNNSDPDYLLEHRLDDAIIEEYPYAFTQAQSASLLQELLKQIPWQQETLKIAGKVIAVPRLQCWMGDSESHYGYSGIRLKPECWNVPVMQIRQRVEKLSALEFNSVLINYYRNGQDSVAWHADDERELGNEPVIASVSFGAERVFQLKRKKGNQPGKFQLTLRHGSVLIMGSGLQDNWLHQLPKVKGLDAPRINLTFRNIIVHG